MNTLKPLVYIAGPYSSPDPVENTMRAVGIADLMLEEGIVTPYVPHLTLFWHFLHPRPIGDWYKHDIEVLLRCDAVLRMTGESKGADLEVATAKVNNIDVFYGLVGLNMWARDHWVMSGPR